MGLDYVDLFLIHDRTSRSVALGADSTATAAKEAGISQAEAWRQMEAVHQEGLAKSIGVSNFRPRHLKCVSRGTLS